jgi:transcription elongation GreA/GreB family factor
MTALPRPTKASLRGELVSLIEADLAARSRAYRAAREGATHEESKPENDKDTRALEQSYLARGEAMRVEELQAALAETQTMALRDLAPTDPVGLGAVVMVEEAGLRQELFVAPHGGGARVGAIHIVTPKSPIGRALIGTRAGDDCEFVVAGKTRELRVVAVR